MSTESLYKKGSKVWIPHVNKVWEWAVILEDYNVDTKNLIIETGLGCEIKTLNIDSNSDLPHLCDPEDSAIDEKKNLASLRSANEADVLNNLQLRFEKGCIYNYCGVTTVFLNPFLKPIPLEADKILNYRGLTIDDVRPHIFAVAEKIFCRLERENRDQSIIFTGKSGGGKTENAKLAILYLATVSAKEKQIKDKITASSTILEAFGNAKTISNDNSSRFGKFIKMQYDANYHIIGASAKIFLLDRSRVVDQIQNEQNYNIFYELCSANDRFSHLQLKGQEFHYLNARNSPEIQSSYSKRFDNLVDAFKKLGFTDREQCKILEILAAILHLGNLKFKRLENLGESENPKSCFIAEPNQLEILKKLFSSNLQSEQDIEKWMCHKKIFSEKTESSRPMSLEEAVEARDSLAKYIYTKLFMWIVAKINSLFRSPCNVRSSIGILDFYGFEKFDVNLFEQFCINYANEKIQQTFIQTVFKLEQQEYLRDNIGWSFMKYQDNRKCLELLEGKNGIIYIIDQESGNQVPREIPWINTVFESTLCKESKYFQRPECNDSADFIIHHFVDHVQYNSREFLEKNRDKVLREHIAFLKDTENEVLVELISGEIYRKSLPRTKSKSRSRSESRGALSEYQTKTALISELKKSLDDLTKELQNTTAHYVRCIKSNDERKSYEFDPVCVAHQIRKYNVLDAIRLSSMGYFSRQTYENFFHRYYCLCDFEGTNRDNMQETCRVIVFNHIEDPQTLKFGEKYIFLKEEDINYLEKVRREKQSRACILIQKAVRRFLQQKRYQETRRAVLTLQRQVRKYLIRRRQARNAAEDHAAVKTQACTMDETEVMAPAATVIQRLFRRVQTRRISEKRLRDIITTQACVRRFLAKIAVDKLRKNKNEQIQLLTEGLKTEMGKLQRNINAYEEMNPTKKQPKEVQMLAEDQQCVRAENRLKNEIAIRRIQNLRDLGRKVKPVEDPVIHEHQDPGEVRARPGDLPAIDEEDLDEEEVKPVDVPVMNELQDLSEEEVIAVDLPVLNEHQDPGEVRARPDDLPTIDEKDLDEEEVNAIELPVMNQLQDPGEVGARPADLPVIDEEDLDEEEVNAIDLPVMNQLQDPGEVGARPADPPVIDDEANSELELCNSILQAYNNFDQRAEKLGNTRAAGINRRQLIAASPARRNANNQLGGEGFFFYEGMFEIETTDVETLLTRLIELPTSIITKHKPGVPSVILFMCLRYLDRRDDSVSASWMLDEYIKKVESVTKQRGDLETILVWLVNTHQLLNYLKQYAIIQDNLIDEFHTLNTDRQNEQCLANLDSTSYQESLLKTAQSLVLKADRLMKTTIHPVVALGILEFNPAETNSETKVVQKQNQQCPLQEQKQAQEQKQKLSKEQVPTHEQKQNLPQEGEQAPGHKQELPQEQRQVQEQAQEQEQNQGPSQEQAQEPADEQKQKPPHEQKQKLVQEQNQRLSQEQVLEQMQEPVPEQSQGPSQEQGQVSEQEQEPIRGQKRTQLLKEKRNGLLTTIHGFLQIMRKSGVKRKMRQQMFTKLFDFMDSILFSYILSHPELCNAFRGTMSRINLRIIEIWASIYDLSAATIALGPIKQALRLLQRQPIDDDEIYWIEYLYDKLNSSQILKILSCYKPAYALDRHISQTVIQRLQFRLMEMRTENDQTIDPEKYAVSFPFQHCFLQFGEIHIPHSFNLPMLRKV